jgi:hypothetical protein
MYRLFTFIGAKTLLGAAGARGGRDRWRASEQQQQQQQQCVPHQGTIHAAGPGQHHQRLCPPWYNTSLSPFGLIFLLFSTFWTVHRHVSASLSFAFPFLLPTYPTIPSLILTTLSLPPSLPPSLPCLGYHPGRKFLELFCEEQLTMMDDVGPQVGREGGRGCRSAYHKYLPS